MGMTFLEDKRDRLIEYNATYSERGLVQFVSNVLVVCHIDLIIFNNLIMLIITIAY